jgi:hypothetical protein
MKTTVHDLRAMLATLPADMPVEFSPISDAWLGTAGPMRWYDFHFFDGAGGKAMPTDEDARMVVYIAEDRTRRDGE